MVWVGDGLDNGRIYIMAGSGGDRWWDENKGGRSSKGGNELGRGVV